jgi:hypothetical protein
MMYLARNFPFSIGQNDQSIQFIAYFCHFEPLVVEPVETERGEILPHLHCTERSRAHFGFTQFLPFFSKRAYALFPPMQALSREL